MKTLVLGGALALTVSSFTAPAYANCAMPSDYGIQVADNTVTVCPENFQNRACPDADGMLRQDAQGATVELADFCSGDAGSSDCFVDECVPKGDYKYGFAKPYDCCPSCCSTTFYATASVTTDVSSSCTRSPGNSPPQPFTGQVPWGGDPVICTYNGGSGGGGSGGGGSGGIAGGSGTGATGPDAGHSGGSKAAGGDDGGCTVHRGHATRIVLVFDGLLAAIGLTLLARRRLPRS